MKTLWTKIEVVPSRWGMRKRTLSLTFTCIAWNNEVLSSPGWTPIKMFHTFPFQKSLINWSMGLLSPSSLESWVCPLSTAWGLVHFCPWLLACPEHLHPPLTSAAVKPSPFLCLTFSQSFLIKELKRWIFFSDIYPVSWDIKKFPITFLSVVSGRLPECSTPGSPSNVSPVMWRWHGHRRYWSMRRTCRRTPLHLKNLGSLLVLFGDELHLDMAIMHLAFRFFSHFKHGCHYSRKIL